MTWERHGPTGSLINGLGGQGWRPSHLHQKYRKKGFQTLTTQAYFAGSKYLDEDPVEGVFDDLVYQLKEEQGLKVLELEIILDAETEPVEVPGIEPLTKTIEYC